MYVMASVDTVKAMTFGGKNVPCAFIRLSSIG